MNSLPSVKANCFSPKITKLPFSITSTTVDEMDPVKLAFCPLVPFPLLVIVAPFTGLRTAKCALPPRVRVRVRVSGNVRIG